MTDRPVRILVVDDAPDVRYVIGRVIERHAAEWQVVAEAADGEEAIEQARIQQPDVVLLDVSMPVLDGLEALPGIRSAAPGAVVIMLSGFDSATAASQALEAGAHAYLTKEDLVASLVPEIRSVLATARA